MRTMKTIAIHDNEPLSLKHLTIRPTGLGWGMLAIAAAAWVLAMNYTLNIAYLLAFWILAFAIWASLQAVWQLYGATLLRIENNECFVGENAVVGVSVRAKNMRHCRVYLRFVLDDNGDTHFKQQEMQLLDTKDNARHAVQLTFPATRRGLVRSPVIQIYTHAPFALLSVSALLQPDWQITVYPAPIEHTVFTPISGDEQGESHAVRQGNDETAYLSPYHAGDSMKRIAWKQYAKNRKLTVRQMETDDKGISDYIISYKDYGEIANRDLIASYLCQRVLTAENQHRRYLLELPFDTIAPQNGQRRKALSALAVF